METLGDARSKIVEDSQSAWLEECVHFCRLWLLTPYRDGQFCIERTSANSKQNCHSFMVS